MLWESPKIRACKLVENQLILRTETSMPEKAALTVALVVTAMAYAARSEELAGKVLQDHSGAPVASADVRVYKIGARGLAADLETDGEGHFEAQGLSAGDYRLEVEKPSYVNATSTFRIDPGSSARLAIRLVRRGAISGRVTSASGQPVSSAMVQALTKTPSGLRPMPRAQGNYSILDESGLYRLFNLAPGEYIVAVSYGAFTTAVSSTGNVPPNTGIGSGFLIYPSNTRPEFLTILGGEELRNVDLTIPMVTSFHLSGKVELPAPKTSFWVTLTAVDQPSMAISVTPAGEDGAFRLAGIPAGSYYLFTTGPVRGRSFIGAMLDNEPLFARSRIEVVQDVADISLTPQKGHSGAVRLKIEPGSETACPHSASIGLTGLEDWGAMLDQIAHASPDKDTPIRNLAATRYQLTARDLGENCYQTGEAILDMTGGDPGPATIPVASAGSIRGRVTGAKDGEFSIVLVPSKSSFGAQPVRSATPDSEGHFSFAALAPGKYRIAAHRASEPSEARWMSAPERMAEIEVRAGKPTELELPAPQPASPQQ